MARYAAAFLAGQRPDAPGHAGPSRQLERWFWRETLAADFIQALRQAAMADDKDATLKSFGSRFFVPSAYAADA